MWMDIKIMYSKLLQRWESFRYLFVVSAVITGTALVSLGQVTVELRNVGHMTASQNDSAGEEHTYDLKLLPNSKRISFMCNITIRKEMDLMKMKSLPFIKRLKNPCWYKGGILQCLPYMFLVGVAKCGTTDLFKRITLHPDFVAPTRKEPNWLSAGRFYRNESFTYYTSTFFSPLSIALSNSESSNLITGEASINTLEGAHFWNLLGNNVGHDEPVENNPEYIYHLNREARILINVRNPVDRLWSEYLAFSKRESKSSERFHEIVLRELRMYRECLQIRSLRSCMYDKTLAKFSTISKEERQNLTKQCNPKPIDIVMLRRGVYHVFIKDYLKVFPRQHVLIQRLEGISADPQRALTQTYKFLGLKIPSKGLIQEILDNDIKNTRAPLDKEKGDMFEVTRSLLHKFYKPHNEQLAILLNNSKYNYGPRDGDAKTFLIDKKTYYTSDVCLRLEDSNGVAFVRQEGDHDCKLITINNIQRNICTERQNEQTINTYNSIPVRTPPSPQTLQKLVCNITFSPEMDLMKMKKLPFIKRFKNPCWYEEKEVRCLPYMHMVGTAKCGSTDLFERIARHPDFVKPTRKEPSWLSSGRFYREESFSFYTKTFFSPISGRLSKVTGSSNLITGDASVYDLHGGLYWRFLGNNVGHDEPLENNAEYIHHLNSKAKILINVRNPIDRLWSEYLALSKAGNISAENFHELILTSIGLYKGCLKTRSLRSCMYDEPLARYTCLTEHERKRFERVRNCRFEGYQAMLYRGVYHVFIKDYVKVFSPDQLLVQRIEDISNHTTEHLLRTFEFLGLEKPPEHLLTGMSHPGRHNPRRPANVKKATC